MPDLNASRSSTTVPRCPRCGGLSAHALDAVDRNRAVTGERFEYRRCLDCGVQWLLNVPADLGSYYPGDYHEFLDADGLAAAAAAESPRLEMLTRYVAGGQLLELGPSQGVFSAAARTAGFDVVALEMDAACCRHLESVVGVRAINTSAPAAVIPELAPSRAAVMWHVIEHLEDPWEVLRRIADNLEPGGVLALATPNPESIQARVFGARWVHLDAPRHVTLIPLGALEDSARESGLALVEATTSDPVGRDLNRLGWERSILGAPALRSDPRLVHTIGGALTGAARRWEERDMRGATYTAVFRKAA
jgi:SAM-dependent methyltransferase